MHSAIRTAGGEHVGEADDHRGGDCIRFGHLKKLEQGAERDAEPFKDRRVVGKDQCDGTDGHNGGQNAEPHAAGVLGAALEEFTDALVLGNALHGEVHAVLNVALVALGKGVGSGLAFD